MSREEIPEKLNTLTQDQMILARSRLWTPELDKLLRRWKKQIGKREKGHLNLARRYTRRHYIIGIPATVLSALIATGVLSTFKNCDSCDDESAPECAADQWIRFVIGIVSIFSAGLTAFQTFMNYRSAAEKHKAAADDCGSMFRILDTLLLVPGPVRGDPISTLQNIRSQYDNLIRRSPTLPKKYDVELTYKVVRPERLRRVKRPRQKKDLSDTKNDDKQLDVDSTDQTIKPKSSKLKKRSKNHRFKGLNASIDYLDSFFAEENDFDSDDEDHDVCIGFDLDSVGCYNTTTIALAAAQLAARRDEQIQNSLQHALNFELQRLEGHSRVPHSRKRSLKVSQSKKKTKDTPVEDKISEIVENSIISETDTDQIEQDNISNKDL
jgi:hypothetical protein